MKVKGIFEFIESYTTLPTNENIIDTIELFVIMCNTAYAAGFIQHEYPFDVEYNTTYNNELLEAFDELQTDFITTMYAIFYDSYKEGLVNGAKSVDRKDS